MAIRGLRITVTDQPTKLTGDGTREVQSVLIKNNSPVACDLGGADVEYGTGFELGAGDSVSIDVEDNEELYCVAPDATGYRIDVIQQGVK